MDHEQKLRHQLSELYELDIDSPEFKSGMEQCVDETHLDPSILREIYLHDYVENPRERARLAYDLFINRSYSIKYSVIDVAKIVGETVPNTLKMILLIFAITNHLDPEMIRKEGLLFNDEQ